MSRYSDQRHFANVIQPDAARRQERTGRRHRRRSFDEIRRRRKWAWSQLGEWRRTRTRTRVNGMHGKLSHLHHRYVYSNISMSMLHVRDCVNHETRVALFPWQHINSGLQFGVQLKSCVHAMFVKHAWQLLLIYSVSLSIVTTLLLSHFFGAWLELDQRATKCHARNCRW